MENNNDAQGYWSTCNELSLVSLIYILIQNKIWVMAGAVLGLFVSVSLIVLTPTLYKSEAVVALGAVPSLEPEAIASENTSDPWATIQLPVENPWITAEELNRQYNVMAVPQKRKSLRVIRASLKAETPKKAQSGLLTALDQVIAKHQELIGQAKTGLPARMPTVPPWLEPTRYISKPTLPISPSQPRVRLLLVAGFFVGLIFGILAAVMKEIWRKSLSRNSV